MAGTPEAETPSRAATPLASTFDAVRRGAKGVAWFCRGVLGADAYEKYRAHVEAEHPRDAAEWLMTEKEFWRDRTDRQDRNPQGRCC